MTAVSVIVLCHNYGRYLEEAVGSVVRQSMPAAELIIVNDGSTDNTESIASQLAARDDRIRLVSHPAPQGLNRSRNSGIGSSTGELLVLLDADDRLSANYLECLSTALLQNGWDFSWPGVRWFGSVEREFPPRPLDVAAIHRNNAFPSSTMFRRTLFDDVGGFNPTLDGVGLDDWDFWLAALEHGARGGPGPGAWLEYRQHAGSLNRISLRRLAQAHWSIHRLHPRSVSSFDFAAGLLRAVLYRSLSRLRSNS